MTLHEFIDRKRQLEIEIATDLERRVAAFEAATGTRVERIFVEPVINDLVRRPNPSRLMTCTVDIRL